MLSVNTSAFGGANNSAAATAFHGQQPPPQQPYLVHASHEPARKYSSHHSEGGGSFPASASQSPQSHQQQQQFAQQQQHHYQQQRHLSPPPSSSVLQQQQQQRHYRGAADELAGPAEVQPSPPSSARFASLRAAQLLLQYEPGQHLPSHHYLYHHPAPPGAQPTPQPPTDGTAAGSDEFRGGGLLPSDGSSVGGLSLALHHATRPLQLPQLPPPSPFGSMLGLGLGSN
jgi:hypothetical protein